MYLKRIFLKVHSKLAVHHKKINKIISLSSSFSFASSLLLMLALSQAVAVVSAYSRPRLWPAMGDGKEWGQQRGLGLAQRPRGFTNNSTTMRQKRHGGAPQAPVVWRMEIPAGPCTTRKKTDENVCIVEPII
ncbi:unnamed protein product [Urochloa humidicola]